MEKVKKNNPLTAKMHETLQGDPDTRRFEDPWKTNWPEEDMEWKKRKMICRKCNKEGHKAKDGREEIAQKSTPAKRKFSENTINSDSNL